MKNNMTPKRITCKLCGRNKFTAKSPHKCKGGYRKRGLIWEIKDIVN